MEESESSPQNTEEISPRQKKAIKLVRDGCVAQVGDGLFQVLSKRTGNGYVVNEAENGLHECECKDFQFNFGRPCKHIFAVVLYGTEQPELIAA